MLMNFRCELCENNNVNKTSLTIKCYLINVRLYRQLAVSPRLAGKLSQRAQSEWLSHYRGPEFDESKKMV